MLNSYHKQRSHQFQVFFQKQGLSWHSHVETLKTKMEKTGKDSEELKLFSSKNINMYNDF